MSLGYFSVQWPNIGASGCFDSAQIGKEDQMDLRTVFLLSLQESSGDEMKNSLLISKITKFQKDRLRRYYKESLAPDILAAVFFHYFPSKKPSIKLRRQKNAAYLLGDNGRSSLRSKSYLTPRLCVGSLVLKTNVF